MGRSDFSREDDLSRDIGAAREPMEFPWWLILLQGIAALVVGVLLITQPSVTILTLVVFLGVYWLVGGVFDLVGIFINRTQWGWKLFTGLLGIAAGLLIVRNPLWAGIAVPTTLVWLLGSIGVIVGVARIIRALMGAGWGAGILGVVSIVLGVILLTRPLFSLSVLVYLAGFWAIVGGIAAIVAAFRLRGNPRLEVSGPA
jgi:uncharacterized membrane protein HdeD (DUF308 family)